MQVVAVAGVTKNYLLGKTLVPALKGIDLTIDKGEFMAIAGPSGSGKTTLLNLIAGIEKPTAGTVAIEGTSLALLSSDALADIRARRIGFIFQNFNLLPVLSALENVEYPLLLSNGTTAAQKRKRAEEALGYVGLAAVSRHKPMELSGGQRQRVAIARAMVTQPALVLADEPTANLDHETGKDILALMKRINQERETTFIFSTHDQKVMTVANRIVHLWDGRLTTTP